MPGQLGHLLVIIAFVASLFSAFTFFKSVQTEQNIVESNSHLEINLKDGVADYSFVPQRLVAAGYRLTLLKEQEVNLETAFMRLTKGIVQ